jgi:hypothetical protein
MGAVANHVEDAGVASSAPNMIGSRRAALRTGVLRASRVRVIMIIQALPSKLPAHVQPHQGTIESDARGRDN